MAETWIETKNRNSVWLVGWLGTLSWRTWDGMFYVLVTVCSQVTVLLMMPQTDLLEVGGVHVAKGLSGHSVMSQDGQVVLSWQFAQQIDQLFLHAGFLQPD